MLSYELVDVFTTVPFAGNQLAVFVDPPRLSTDQLLAIARELNLAETSFAWPTDDPNRFEVRIFTPGIEMPFAGHPTIGTALTLARLGDLSGTLTLDEPIGPVEVDIDQSGDFATLTTATLPERGPGAVVADAYASVGLGPADGTDLPVQPWSCGVPFTILPLADLVTSERCRFDMARWQDSMAQAWGPNIYTLTELGSRRLRCRSFVPDAGLIEDSATGAAASALGGYVATHLAEGDGVHSWVIEQGVEMGRPSELHLEVTVESGTLRKVRVGGSAVSIGSGTLSSPPG
jgi:trans-2,3-dihydro-3-hydroxyanthranilate isomerase